MKELAEFLIAANKAGYAAGDSAPTHKEEDGSTTITFEQDGWKFYDNYFGGEPYGGREVVFKEGKPFWMMVYYGWVDSTVEDVKGLYTFLQKALSQPDRNLPVRGPKELTDEDWSYQAKWQGDLEQFQGEETITDQGSKKYQAFFIGGLVDQR